MTENCIKTGNKIFKKLQLNFDGHLIFYEIDMRVPIHAAYLKKKSLECCKLDEVFRQHFL